MYSGFNPRYQYGFLYTRYQVQSKGSSSLSSDITLDELKTMTDKFSFNFNLSYPWRGFPWLSVTPSITLLETWFLNNKAKLFLSTKNDEIAREWGDYEKMEWGEFYSGYYDLTGSEPKEFFPKERWPEQVVLNGNDLRRDLYSANLVIIGPQFYRVFDTQGFMNIEKINHTIEPKIDFNYIPDVCYGYGTEFDEFNNQSSYMIMGDVVAPMNSVTYTISNRFFGKILKEGIGEDKREIGHINFSQQYDFRQQKRADKLKDRYRDDPNYFIPRTEEPFSNIRTELRIPTCK